MARSPVKREASKPSGGTQPTTGDTDGIETRDGLSSAQVLAMEEQYRSIFEAAGEAMVIADLDSVVAEVNPAACQLFGYTREELVGLSASTLLHPGDLMPGSVLRREVGLRKDGSLFHAEGRVTDLSLKGEPHVVVAVRDVSERVQAEEQLRERERDVTERVRAYELLQKEVEDRTRELSTLLDVTHNVSSTLELQPLLGMILDQLKMVVSFDGATVMAVEGEDLVNLYRQGPGRSGHVVQRRFPAASQELLWTTLQRGAPVIIGDVRGDTALAKEYRRINGKLLETTLSYVRSWMGVPMVLKERVVGVLSLASRQTNCYAAHDASLVRAVANQAAIAIENARLYEQSVQRTSELSALLDVSHTVASTLELEPLLDLILDQLNLVADNDGITLLEVQGDEFVVLLRRVPGHEDQEFPRSYSAQGHGPIWDKLRRGEVAVIGNVRGDDSMARAYRRTVGDFLDTSLSFEASFMAVPLMLKDRIIGLLGLSSARSDHYNPHHGEVALAIAQQAAVAIENARLYQKAQEAAVLEERQRLSRELHDSVSQALYGIGLAAQTARTLVERDPAEAIRPLDYVVSLAKTGLAEMRALILELRPETLEQEGLTAVLQQQAEAITARHPVQVTTVLCAEPEAPLAAKEALYRIAQEAVHNTVKHAEATEVRLSLEQSGEDVVLAIEDNGRGFDTTGSYPGHLGLHSMRERVERFGGTLEIESAVGIGTTVSVRIPL
jgi:PAS domain S-box-containing protein